MAEAIRSTRAASTKPQRTFSKYEARRAILERHDFSGHKVSGSTCKLVALALCHYVNGVTGETWVSVLRLASELGKARSTIQSALRALESCGVIRRADSGIGGRQTATYKLLVGRLFRIESEPSDLETAAAEPARQPVAARAAHRESPCSPPPESGVFERERLLGAPPAEVLPPRDAPSPAVRLGGTGAPGSHNQSGGVPEVESAQDPGYAAAAAIAVARNALETERAERWGVGTYRECPRAWAVMVRVCDRVATRSGVSFPTAARAVAAAYVWGEDGRKDGALLREKHPPEWFVHYAESSEARAVQMIARRAQQTPQPIRASLPDAQARVA